VCERQCKEQLEDMDRVEQSGNDEDDIDLRPKGIRDQWLSQMCVCVCVNLRHDASYDKAVR